MAYYLIPAVIASAACLLGQRRARFAFGLALAVGVGAASGLWWVPDRARGVTQSSFQLGVAIAVLGASAPVIAYYALGRWLSKYKVLLPAVWVVSLVALYPFAFYVALIAYDKIACEPGAYECPL